MNTLLLLALLSAPSPLSMPNRSVYGTAMDRDAAAPPLTYVGKAPLNTFANTNTAGGSIEIGGASGLVKITGVTQAGTAGDTVTIVYRKMGVSAATTVVLTEGADFVCAAAASDAACVSNFVTAFNANTNIAGYLLAVYVAASETASIGVVDGMGSAIVSFTPSDTTNFVSTKGAFGQVLFGNGTSALPPISFSNDSDTGIYQLAANNIGLTAGGGNVFNCTSSGCTSSATVGSSLQTPNGSRGFVGTATKGFVVSCTANTTTLTFSAGGDASKTWTGGRPLGSTNFSLTGYVTVADTSAAVSFNVGDGTDPDLYAAAVPTDSVGQTFGPTIASYGPTAQLPATQITAAGDIVITPNVNAEDMAVRLTASYCISTPDTTL